MNITPLKNVILLVNDIRPEYVEAFNMLEKKTNTKLRGIVLLDSKVKNLGLNMAPLKHEFEVRVCDFDNLISMQYATKDIVENVLLVACQSERNQPYLAKLVPFLTYNVLPSESAISWSISKSKMRDLLSSFDGSLVPKYVVIESSDMDIDKATTNMKFPMIVKPNGLAESMLVSRCNDKKQLHKIVDLAFKKINEVYKRDNGRGKPMLLIEEFIEGDMFSIDAYIDNEGVIYHLPIIHVTTAHAAGYEGFYSYRNDVLDKNMRLSVDEEGAKLAVTKALKALKLRNSVAHVELFSTVEGWKVIELGPRIGGYRQDMYYFGYGIHHAFNEFLLKSGFEPIIYQDLKEYCNIVNVYAEQEGVISSIEGLEVARDLESVVYLDQYGKIGDNAYFSTNGGKLILDGVLKNKSFDLLNKDNQALRNSIKIITKPFVGNNINK